MFDKLLVTIAKNLEKAEIPYMIIGGQAVLQYGEARLTNDIDVTLGVDVDKLSIVLKLVRRVGLEILRNDVRKFVKQTYVLPVREMESGIRIDFIFSNSSYEKQAIQRSKGIRINKQLVQFASVEDVIIQKIIAGRPRDLEDISKLIVKQKKFNTRYIRKWLKTFEVTMNIPYSSTFNKLFAKSK